MGKAINGKRDQVTLATKFGMVRDPKNPTARELSGKPDYVLSSCVASLKRLDEEIIDVYYLHRVDPSTSIEDSVGAMAQLVKSGKIKTIGLSEVSTTTLRKAHTIHPITAVQSEYSLWSCEPENGMLEICKELGIAFDLYSPLGRGFLTGQIKKFDDLAIDDWRRVSPVLWVRIFGRALYIVSKLDVFAKKKGCTSS